MQKLFKWLFGPKPIWDIISYKSLGTIYHDSCGSIDLFHKFAVKEVDLNSGGTRWREVWKLDFEAERFEEFLKEKTESSKDEY